MTRRNRTAGSPRTRTNTVIGFRLEQAALADLDALVDAGNTTRSALAEKFVREAMDATKGGKPTTSIAEQKAVRQTVMEFKKEAGAALWDVVQKWADRPRTVRMRQNTSMECFIGDIEAMTSKNADFRRVLHTGEHLQLVLMTLQPGEDIGKEVHPDRDQFFRVEQGTGEAWIEGKKMKLKGGSAVLVPAGARHNIMANGIQPLKLYTLYAPPEHADGTVHATKADAQAAKEHFDGKTTERRHGSTSGGETDI